MKNAPQSQSQSLDNNIDVIPAGSEEEFGEEADLSSLFNVTTDTAYVFNDSVEVFLAKHNEDAIHTVSTSESSTADTTAQGDFMNDAIMAEEEDAPTGDSDDELPESEDVLEQDCRLYKKKLKKIYNVDELISYDYPAWPCSYCPPFWWWDKRGQF